MKTHQAAVKALRDLKNPAAHSALKQFAISAGKNFKKDPCFYSSRLGELDNFGEPAVINLKKIDLKSLQPKHSKCLKNVLMEINTKKH